MEIVYLCKEQVCCLVILMFISHIFITEGNKVDKLTEKSSCNPYFDRMFIMGEVTILFDMITMYTVNHLDTVSRFWNGLFHYLFFASYELFVVILFSYWLSVSGRLPKKWWHKVLCYGPCVISLVVTALLMPQIHYDKGVHSNYSMGAAVYSCFVVIGIYLVMTLFMFFRLRRYIKKNHVRSLVMSMLGSVAVLALQMVFPDLLMSSLAVMLIIISVYLGMENPSVKTVEIYHEEMLLGFSTLLEKKDGGTGGHIRRTSEYAVLIARQLGHKAKYRSKINKDYVMELKKAAPMHDIGKISIPDNILQKPGKLTAEEFEVMKTHSEEGAKIIAESFRHVVEEDETSMPYKVALYHHEKWNGKGYPTGLSGTDIPLCARIMAVADVFDAVSAKRCYRDAMPLETCFQIIADGKGTDFDPEIVEAFFERKEAVIQIYERFREA